MLLRKAIDAALIITLLVGCQATASARDPVSSISVPAALQGAWYVGQSCNDVSSYFFRGDGWSVGIAEQADSRTIIANSSTFSVLEMDPNGSVVVSAYWRDPATGAFVPAKFKLTPSNSGLEGSYVFPPATAKVPNISEIRCDDPEVAGKPWQLASLYLSDLTSILGSVSTVQQACNAGAHACAAAVIAVLDLNHDGKVSPAELVSFLRRASKLGFLLGKTIPGTNMSHAEFTLDQVMGAELGMAVAGPIFAQIVMSNIDYNGDGFIEPQELETFLRQVGVPPGRDYLEQLIESAESSAEQAARSLSALEEVLGAFGGH